MPYGVFTYTVHAPRRSSIPPTSEIVKPVGFEELVMTACHPVYSAAQRYAVFSKLTRIDTFSIGGTGAWVAP